MLTLITYQLSFIVIVAASILSTLSYKQFCRNNDTNCLVDCKSLNNTQCSSSIIDGLSSTSLTVLCDAVSICLNTTILCPTNSSCDIICDSKDACNGAQIVTSNANAINLKCNGFQACQNSHLLAPNTKNKINISCLDIASCDEALFNVSHSNNTFIDCRDIISCNHANIIATASTELTLNCLSAYSCFSVDIFAPTTINSFELNCAKSNGYSCGSISIYTTSYFDLHFMNLSCPDALANDDTDCDDFELYCMDIEQGTHLIYDSFNDQYICDNYHCCPILEPQQTVECVDKHCIIDCTQQPCYNFIFNAENASSLTVKCHSYPGCSHSSIYCPVESNSICDIHCNGTSSCFRTNIFYNGANETNVMCNQEASCLALSVITAAEIVNISCNAWRSCYGLYLIQNVENKTNPTSTIIDCDYYYYSLSCYAAVFEFKYVDMVHVKCVDADCRFTTFEFINIDNVTVNCLSCYYGLFYYSNVNNVYLLCNSYETNYQINYGCYGVDIIDANASNDDVGIVDTLVLDCIGWRSCGYLYIANIVMDTTDVIVNCSSERYACSSTSFVLHEANRIDMICDSEHSCDGSQIYATHVDILNIYCNGRYSCGAMDIYPNHQQMNSVSVYCVPADYSCLDVDIIVVSDEYITGYLNLYCQYEDGKQSNQCDQIDIVCGSIEAEFNINETVETDTMSSVVYFIGDSNVTTTCCDNDNCCPFNKRYTCSLLNGTLCQYGLDSLDILCGEKGICAFSILICQENRSCNIQCTADYSCQYLTIFAQTDTIDVNLECLGESACDHLILYAEYANSIAVSGYGNHTLYGVDIYATHSPKVLVNCYISYGRYSVSHRACFKTSIYGSQLTTSRLVCEDESCQYIDLYSLNGVIDWDIHIILSFSLSFYHINSCALSFYPHLTIHIICGYDGLQLDSSQHNNTEFEILISGPDDHIFDNNSCVNPSCNCNRETLRKVISYTHEYDECHDSYTSALKPFTIFFVVVIFVLFFYPIIRYFVCKLYRFPVPKIDFICWVQITDLFITLFHYYMVVDAVYLNTVSLLQHCSNKYPFGVDSDVCDNDPVCSAYSVSAQNYRSCSYDIDEECICISSKMLRDIFISQTVFMGISFLCIDLIRIYRILRLCIVGIVDPITNCHINAVHSTSDCFYQFPIWFKNTRILRERLFWRRQFFGFQFFGLKERGWPLLLVILRHIPMYVMGFIISIIFKEVTSIKWYLVVGFMLILGQSMFLRWKYQRKETYHPNQYYAPQIRDILVDVFGNHIGFTIELYLPIFYKNLKMGSRKKGNIYYKKIADREAGEDTELELIGV